MKALQGIPKSRSKQGFSESVTCPECGADTSMTIDSRRSDSIPGAWRRRRVCPNGHRYSTIEQVAGIPALDYQI